MMVEKQTGGTPGLLAPSLEGAGGRVIPGGHLPSPQFVSSHQRARLISAIAEEAVGKGSHRVTVAAVVSRAGVSRNAFYEHFTSKAECLLMATEAAKEQAMQRVAKGVAQAPDSWPAQVQAGIAAFLAYAASEPALARISIAEGFSSSPGAIARYEETVRAIVPLFRIGRERSPDGPGLPDTLEKTIVGGIFWVAYQRIVAGRAAELEDLLPELVEFALTPYLGAAVARRAARA